MHNGRHHHHYGPSDIFVFHYTEHDYVVIHAHDVAPDNNVHSTCDLDDCPYRQYDDHRPAPVNDPSWFEHLDDGPSFVND